jgi:hypothetical protein
MLAPPSKEYQRAIRSRKPSTRDAGWLTKIQIKGVVNLQRFPELNTEALDRLVDTIIQHTCDFLLDPVHDLKSDALALELANIIAMNFVKNQQDLVLHECWLNLQRNPEYPLLESRTIFGHPQMDSRKSESLRAEGKGRFFVALGSNVGNRLDMIERACLEMKNEGIDILRTSGLWETKAMYVEDQANFLNGVCEVRSYFPLRRSIAWKYSN